MPVPWLMGMSWGSGAWQSAKFVHLLQVERSSSESCDDSDFENTH